MDRTKLISVLREAKLSKPDMNAMHKGVCVKHIAPRLLKGNRHHNRIVRVHEVITDTDAAT